MLNVKMLKRMLKCKVSLLSNNKGKIGQTTCICQKWY